MDELVKQQLERITRLSHDFKGPLNTIYGAFQILEMHDEKHENRKYYTAAERNIRKMTRMIEHFTSYYYMTQNEVRLNAKMIDGRAMVESFCNAVSDCFLNDEVELVTNIQGNGTVCLDEIMVESAFMNLVSNGVKATKNLPCRLEIGASFEHGDLTLSVKDFGMGVSSEDQKRIFEPLIQLGTFEEGTGLGLSCVFEVAQLHGGEILLESELGKGSTFTLKIPFLKPMESASSNMKQFDPGLDRLYRTKIEMADLL